MKFEQVLLEIEKSFDHTKTRLSVYNSTAYLGSLDIQICHIRLV